MIRKLGLPIAVVAASFAIPFVTRSAFAQGGADDFKAEPASSSSAAPSAAPMGSAPPPATSASVADPKADPYAPAATSAAPPPPPKPAPKEDDPLTIPDGIKDDIGTSHYGEDKPTGERSRVGLWPLAYKERIGNVITSAVFPFYYDRRTFDSYRTVTDRESFYGLYYRRRSKKFDVDAAFPIFFRWREEDTTTTVVPPVLWRDGPKGEWHRWLAPLFFASSQPDGGYFHAPLLLTFSHHNPKSAFSLIGGIGYYDRTEKDVDWGVVPFVFAGNNADKLTSYYLIPPLLTYHSEDKDNSKQTTVVGPVVYKTAPGSVVFDILPLYLYKNDEKSRSMTFLPFFHSSSDKKDGSSLLVTPLFISSQDDAGGRTLVTPLYSRYRGRTTLDLAGPIIPLFVHHHDPDRYRDTYLAGPVLWSSDPTGYSLLTPLFGHWNERGVSKSTWVFPTFHHTTTPDSWSFNIYPFVFASRDKDSSHSILAPIFWDFVAPKKRSTVVFPLFWRFADDEGTTQLALNTLYLDKPATKGKNWDFYFLPLFHVGEQPQGNSWDVLFGFVGYKREGSYKQLKLFWIPIDLTKPPAPAAAPAPAK